jgi:hypothetical protein
MKQDDFGYFQGGDCTLRPDTPYRFHAFDLSERATVIKPVLELFQAALNKKVTVFFVIGRFESVAERAATTDNLTRAGYVGWKEMIMRTPIAGCSTVCFKTNERAAIEAEGYTIIANVGDQWSDLDPLEGDPAKGGIEKGSHAERIFKLPNPFYVVPCTKDFVCGKIPFVPINSGYN